MTTLKSMSSPYIAVFCDFAVLDRGELALAAANSSHKARNQYLFLLMLEIPYTLVVCFLN